MKEQLQRSEECWLEWKCSSSPLIQFWFLWFFQLWSKNIKWKIPEIIKWSCAPFLVWWNFVASHSVPCGTWLIPLSSISKLYMQYSKMIWNHITLHVVITVFILLLLITLPNLEIKLYHRFLSIEKQHIRVWYYLWFQSSAVLECVLCR